MAFDATGLENRFDILAEIDLLLRGRRQLFQLFWTELGLTGINENQPNNQSANDDNTIHSMLNYAYRSRIFQSSFHRERPIKEGQTHHFGFRDMRAMTCSFVREE